MTGGQTQTQSEDETRCEHVAKRAGQITFLLLAVLGIAFVWFCNSHDFGPSTTTTTVGVYKGSGAGRTVTRSKPKAEPEAGSSDEEGEEVESKTAEPNGHFARATVTTEQHQKSFLESLVGNEGLLILQMAAVILGAFAGAAIMSRFFLGRFGIKIAGVEIPDVTRVKDALVEKAGSKAALEALSERGKPPETIIRNEAIAIARVLEQSGFPSESTGDLESEILQKERVLLAAAGIDRPVQSDKAMGRKTNLLEQGSVTTMPDEPKRHDSIAEPKEPLDDRVKSMERLLALDPESPPASKDSALLDATLTRSRKTYRSICVLLEGQVPIQAGMLIEPLFDDVVLAHVLVRRPEDAKQAADDFVRDRTAAARLREALEERTVFRIPFDVEQVKPTEVKADAMSLSDLVGDLKAGIDTAEDLFGSFSAQDKPFLAQLNAVIEEWLARFARPTPEGLPLAGETAGSDPTDLVAFVAAWLFAMQVYLAAGRAKLSGDEIDEIDRTWYSCLVELGYPAIGLDNTVTLLRQWADRDGAPGDGPR